MNQTPPPNSATQFEKLDFNSQLAKENSQLKQQILLLGRENQEFKLLIHAQQDDIENYKKELTALQISTQHTIQQMNIKIIQEKEALEFIQHDYVAKDDDRAVVYKQLSQNYLNDIQEMQQQIQQRVGDLMSEQMEKNIEIVSNNYKVQILLKDKQIKKLNEKIEELHHLLISEQRKECKRCTKLEMMLSQMKDKYRGQKLRYQRAQGEIGQLMNTD